MEYRFVQPAGAVGIDLVMLHEGLGSVRRHSPHRDQPQAVLAAAKQFVAGLASMRGRSTSSRTA